MGKRKTGNENKNGNRNENDPGKTLLRIKKGYEKSFLRTALALCLYQIKYKIISGLADFIFSGEKQKPTAFLRYINRSLNKNLCKCQITAEKCEYYKQKIEKMQSRA